MDMTVPTTDLFQELGYYGVDPELMCLTMGAPGKEMLRMCAELLEKATTHRLAQEAVDGYLFQYGARLGDWHFRKNLAKFLTVQYRTDVSVANLMVTCGASHGLYMTASLLFGKGYTVFVEDPTYFVAINVLRDDLGMKVKALPMDEEGLCIESLKKKLAKLPALDKMKPYRAMLYLIPAYQNPTGICYSHKRCQDLVDLAKEYDVLILCDDVYNMLTYSQFPTPTPIFLYERLSNPDEKGHVISNCTFSKIFAPGLRLGWFQSCPYILKLFYNSGVIRSGGNFNNYMSGIMSSVLELGFQASHLETLIDLCSRRSLRACEILQRNLPSSCSFKKPLGGYFVWVTLGPDFNSEKFAVWLKDTRKISVQPGNRCSAYGNFTNCLRIAVTFLTDMQLDTAVIALCLGIKEYIALSNVIVNFVKDDAVKPNQLKTMRRAHTDGVLNVASVSTGACLSGSSDKSVVLYDYELGDIRETWYGHDKNVTKVVYNWDHNLAISGSRDNTVRVWHHQHSQPLHVLDEHQLTVTGLALCPDNGNLLCSGSRDNSLRLWDIQAGSCVSVQTLSRNLVTDLKWARCSSFIAQTSEDKELKIWDPRALQLVHSFPKKLHIQTSCDISHDSRYCVTSSNGFARNGCEATLWDLRQCRLLHEYFGHLETIEACAFLPNSEMLGTVSNDGTARIWKRDVPECVGSLMLDDVGTMTSLAFPSPCTLLISTLRGGIQLLNLVTASEQVILKRIAEF